MRQMPVDAAVQDMQSSAAVLLVLGIVAGVAGIIFGLRAVAAGRVRLSRKRDLGGPVARAVGLLTVLLSAAYLAYVAGTAAAIRRVVREMDERLHPRPPVTELRWRRDEPGPHSPDLPADVPGVVEHLWRDSPYRVTA